MEKLKKDFSDVAVIKDDNIESKVCAKTDVIAIETLCEDYDVKGNYLGCNAFENIYLYTHRLKFKVHIFEGVRESINRYKYMEKIKDIIISSGILSQVRFSKKSEKYDSKTGKIHLEIEVEGEVLEELGVLKGGND